MLARTPLLIWHPDGDRNGDRIDALTATVDIYSTVLDVFDVESEGGPHSRSLWPVLSGAAKDHRDWAIYGYWGSSVNVTDGTYMYLHPMTPIVSSAGSTPTPPS